MGPGPDFSKNGKNGAWGGQKIVKKWPKMGSRGGPKNGQKMAKKRPKMAKNGHFWPFFTKTPVMGGGSRPAQIFPCEARVSGGRSVLFLL